MKTRIFFAILAILGLLASCAMNPHPMDMTNAIRSAKASADHNALAKHYEDTAQEMQLKVVEHKKILEEYEAHPYYYGRGTPQDMAAHCRALIHYYEQAAEENISMARAHRQMAEEAK